VDFNKVAALNNLKISGGGLKAMVTVGTREGRVLVYKVDTQEAKIITKTKSGVVFGEVVRVAINDKGT
jgi:hypothetical protein